WPIAPLEDNVFALLNTKAGQVASLHASWTQWRNMFSFEVYGRDGYVSVDGLGGSYGTEQVTLGKRAFLEPFREEITVYRGEDRSWADEWQEFVSAIRSGNEPLGSGRDGMEAQILADAIYESARKGKIIKVAAGSGLTASAVNEPS
ncbi:MAG: Gfo/Idh/MocA family oxidoreductase, partial [Dehalococcoidia bacterium]